MEGKEERRKKMRQGVAWNLGPWIKVIFVKVIGCKRFSLMTSVGNFTEGGGNFKF